MPRARTALHLLLASVAISCLIGIFAIVAGDLDRTTGKLLASSLSISGASLLAMAAFAGWEHVEARLFARACVAATAIAVVGLVLGIWADPRGEVGWKLIASVMTLALATAHATVISLVRLAPTYHAVRTMTIAAGTLLVSATLAMLWGQDHGTGWFQIIGVLAIVDTGLTLAIVVCHFSMTSSDVCFCPGCGKQLWLPAGDIHCHHCQRAFTIALRDHAELAPAVVRSA